MTENSNGLKRIRELSELVPLAAAVGGCRPLRAEDDTRSDSLAA